MSDLNQDEHRRNPLRLAIWSTAVILLLLPAVAMQFTTEVNWTRMDFIVFGAMLLFVCGGYELGARMSGNKAYRLAFGIALVGVFLLTWMNLAVGIIGNEENPANQIFFAVPAVGILGALMARFKPIGMARTMAAVAAAQAMIALIAVLAGWGQVFFLSGIFVCLWLISAHLFRKSAPP